MVFMIHFHKQMTDIMSHRQGYQNFWNETENDIVTIPSL